MTGAQTGWAITFSLLMLAACDGKGTGPAPDSDGDSDSGTDSDTDTGSGDCFDTGGGTDPGWADTGDTRWPPADADCDGYGVARGDCDDDDPERGPAAVEIAGDGVDANCDGLDIEVESLEGVLLDDAPSYTRAGQDLAAGDLDGDGYVDLVVSTPGTFNNELARSAAGADTSAIVVPGPITERRVLGDELSYSGPKDDFNVGDLPVATPGDLDGDGYAELAYGFPNADGEASNSGVVLVAPGPAEGSAGLDLGQIIGSDESDGLGYQLASPGDLDGDGRPDLLVSAPGAHDVGEVYAFPDPAGAVITRDDAVFLLSGEDEGALAGTSMAADDLDDDGHPDLIVGRFLKSTDAGDLPARVWVISGPLEGTAVLSSASAIIDSEDPTQPSIGRALAPVGDVDGDGLRDLAIGSASFREGDDGYSAEGRAWLFLGPVEGGLSTAGAGAVFPGLAAYDSTGAALGSPGDLDADGAAEILVSATPEAEPFSRIGLWSGPVGGDLEPATANRVFVSQMRLRAVVLAPATITILKSLARSCRDPPASIAGAASA